VVLLPVGTIAAAAQGFDGVTTFQMHGDKGDKTSTMVQSVKGQKIRMDMEDPAKPSGGGAIIIDAGTQTTTMLMPEQKQYLQFTGQDVRNFAAKMKPVADSINNSMSKEQPSAPQADKPDAKLANFTVTKTGTDMVAGVSCDIYHASGTDTQGKHGEGDICAAKGAGFVMYNMMGAMAGANPMAAPKNADPKMQAYYDMMKQVTSEGRGIVKVTTYDNGKKTVVLEATKIDKTPPPDAVFDIPPGYTKFSIGAAMAGQSGTQGQSVGSAVANGAGQAAAAGAQGAVNEAAHDAAAKAVKKAFHFP
jgi:hypothetical protein